MCIRDSGTEEQQAIKIISRQVREVRKLLIWNKNAAFIHPEDREFYNIMMSASSYVSTNKTDCKKRILLALLQSSNTIKDNQSKEQATKKSIEISDFADTILEEISNFSKVKIDHNCHVRFSPCVMRMALSLYLKGATAYKAFQQFNIQVMPSISALRKLKYAMTPKEGTFPKCYGWFKDEFFDTGLSTEARQ